MNQTFASSPTKPPQVLTNNRNLWKCRAIFETRPRLDGGIEIEPENVGELKLVVMETDLSKALPKMMEAVISECDDDHVTLIAFEAELLPPVIT